MMNREIAIFFYLLGVIGVLGQHIPPKVTLKHGGIAVGMKKDVYLDETPTKLDVFLGIPYANPPIKEKRFKPPEEYSWQGEVNTNRLPPTCWQYMYGPDTFEMKNPAARMWVNNTEMSEDCLYLNVWKPSNIPSGSKLPVMVWIYGGGYVSGTSTLEVYNASIIVAKYNIVVMSMQYRIGAFGFLRLGDSGDVAAGNMGLLDQTMALKWMHDNIELFGGDPNSVTVFGESSGAVSSSLLWLSPKANQYFKRLIIESGSALTRWAVDTKSDAENRGRQFAAECGCTGSEVSELMQCLRNADEMTLVNALYNITVDTTGRTPLLEQLFPDRMSELREWTENFYLYFDVPLKAVIDGSFIPDDPMNILSNPGQSSLPTPPEVLLGVNENEGMYFLLYGLILNGEYYLHSDGSILLPDAVKKAAARENLEGKSHKADFELISAAQILSKHQLTREVFKEPAEFYRLPSGDSGTPLDPKELMKRLDAMTGELDFICPVLMFANKVAAMQDSSVYLYELQYKTQKSGLPDWVGVMHGYEIEYVFGMPYSSTFQSRFYEFTPEEKKLSEQMMNWWTNFAIYGNPNGQNDALSTWPKYTPGNDGQYFKLKLQSEVAQGFHKQGCDFWRNRDKKT